MKTLNIPLEEIDYKKIVVAKGDMTWTEFLLDKTEKRGRRK